MNVKKMLLTATLVLILGVATTDGWGVEPLANQGKDGLYVRSMQQVLRLSDDQMDMATAALIASEEWSDVVQGLRYLETLDKMAYEIRDLLKAKNIKNDYHAVPVINEYLFVDQGFSSVKEAADPNDLFLHSVLDKKNGYCLSLSVLYLSIGERLGIPLYGVVVPGHFFVRYDDGRTRFNIETTGGGNAASDEYYISKFKVPEGDKTIYMKNLGKMQSLGCLFNNLGNAYSGIGDYDKAMEILETAVTINPSLAESRMNLGNIYLKKGRYNDATDQYQGAIEINPNDAKAHLNLGNAYFDRGRTADAIAEYKTAMGLDDNLVETYKSIALVYAKQRQFLLALTELTRASRIQPGDATIYCQLGDVYTQMGEYEKAMELYGRALKLKPNLAQAHYGQAMCCGRQGMVDKEIAGYKKALEIDPRMVGALVNLGNVYVTRGDYDAAIEQYSKAIMIKSDDAMIYYNFGTAFAKKGDFKQAAEQYEKAVSLDTNMGDAHNGLAYCYYRLSKFEPALKHIKTAQELGVKVDPKLVAAIEKQR